MSTIDCDETSGYDLATIKRIQRTVGASPDGEWGPCTARRVRAWQRQQGLPADGKAGPATLAHFQTLWARDAKPEGDEALDDLDHSVSGAPRVEPGDDAIPDNAPAPSAGSDYFDRDGDLAQGAAGDPVFALQNDLFGFGFECGKFDADLGPKMVRAIQAFQGAAATLHRIRGYQAIELERGRGLSSAQSGVVDGPTRAEIRRWKQARDRWCDPQQGLQERRVRVAALGTLPRSSVLLTKVPSVGEREKMLHCLAVESLTAMSAAACADGLPALAAASAWRPHRWSSRADYEATMVARYGSVSEGSKWVAYCSPHETGLAIDFGVGGLEPKRASADAQRETELYAWLVANAYRFGWHPYMPEPWHWEHPLSLRAWTTGVSDWRVGLDDDE